MILSGTEEGPRLARILLQKGWNVTVSVVSRQASIPYINMQLNSLRIGTLNGVEGIKALFKEAETKKKRFDWVLDLTHPFAVVITNSLIIACKEYSIPLIRYERLLSCSDNAKLIPDFKELSKMHLKGHRVLLAIGARHLQEVVSCCKESGADVFARVLPNPHSVQMALNASLEIGNLAISRPFDQGDEGLLEQALCRYWSVTGVVCRQSGSRAQRFWEEICLKENLDLWLIRRPDLSAEIKVFNNFQDLLNRLEST